VPDQLDHATLVARHATDKVSHFVSLKEPPVRDQQLVAFGNDV
jgi:hypothetical protein